jgi:hypothetical protein
MEPVVSTKDYKHKHTHTNTQTHTHKQDNTITTPSDTTAQWQNVNSSRRQKHIESSECPRRHNAWVTNLTEEVKSTKKKKTEKEAEKKKLTERTTTRTKKKKKKEREGKAGMTFRIGVVHVIMTRPRGSHHICKLGSVKLSRA